MQLVYFANPMCSWCWGFSPVIQKLKDQFVERVGFRLVLTPFRVDTTKAMDDALRNYVLKQWHKVQQTTSQPFDFTFAVEHDFVYNTKPACRAVKSFSRQQPTKEFNYLSDLQAAFYINNLNITRQEILIEVAEAHNINIELFIKDLHTGKTNQLLDEDFNYCLELGVQSYPTLIGIKRNSISVLAHGFQPYENLELKAKEWLGEIKDCN